MNLDAIRSVQASLAEKNFAIIHRDELFGSEHADLWDEADQFMDKFAASPEAAEFEAAFNESVRQIRDIDARERAALAPTDAEYHAAQAALDRAKRGGPLPGWVPFAAKAGQIRLAAAERGLAKVAKQRKTIKKSFDSERKSKTGVFKPYIFTLKHQIGRSPKYSDAPILLSATPPVLAIADAYYGEKAKARVPAIWRVSKVPEDVGSLERMGSQRWHRDQTDRNILKLFIYFSDVDEGAGALEYIPDSLPVNSRWSEKIPLTDQTGYPPPELIETLVPKEEIVRCSGKRGTLVFVDTAGLHRGGYALEKIRITSQTTYLRQNPKIPQTPLLKGVKTERPLTPDQVFAFS
jgi:hypothetical protein